MTLPHDQAQIAYSKSKRIECLDSIRGLAALAVLLGHILGAYVWPGSLVAWCRVPILNMIFDGRSAVTMFFVLSGFVLSHPYLAPDEERSRPRQLFIPTFYLRRLTRIWPPWLAAFVLSAFAKRYLFSTHLSVPPPSAEFAQIWHAPLSVGSFLRQCVFLLHDARQQLIPQDWSLGVELKGSALIPIFLFLVRRSIPALAVAVVALVIFHPTGYWYMSFAVGVWAARYHRRMESSLQSLGVGSKWALLTVGVLFYESRPIAHCCWEYIDGGVIDKTVWCLASIGCAFIMAASMSSNRIQSKLKLSPVLLLGRISYSVYLVQFIVILCVLAPLMPLLNAAGLRNVPMLFPLTLGAAILATVAISLILYYSVEVPSMALGRWLTKLIQGRWAKHNS